MSEGQDARREAAERSRAMVLTLSEQLTKLLHDSGATEEECLAALKSAEATIPLLRLNSSLHGGYFG
jgi:hypothetical protein